MCFMLKSEMNINEHLLCYAAYPFVKGTQHNTKKQNQQKKKLTTSIQYKISKKSLSWSTHRLCYTLCKEFLSYSDFSNVLKNVAHYLSKG